MLQIEKLIKIVLQPLYWCVSAKPKVNLRAINQRHLFFSILKSALRVSQPLHYLAVTIFQFTLQLLSNQFLYWENEFYPLLISLRLLLVSKIEKRAKRVPSIPGGMTVKIRWGMAWTCIIWPEMWGNKSYSFGLVHSRIMDRCVMCEEWYMSTYAGARIHKCMNILRYMYMVSLFLFLMGTCRWFLDLDSKMKPLFFFVLSGIQAFTSKYINRKARELEKHERTWID